MCLFISKILEMIIHCMPRRNLQTMRIDENLTSSLGMAFGNTRSEKIGQMQLREFE